MSSSLSNHDSALNTVLGTISTTHDELQPASIVRGRPNSTKASSVMISGRAPTQGAGFTASIIPIEQRVTPTTASGDDKLLSGRECLVHKGGGETAGSAAAPDEAAAVSSCERECGSNDAVHTDTNRRRNNHSECDSSATAASTDKYSCDLEGTMGVGGGGSSSSSSNIADHEEEVSLQVVQKATAEYSSSARESEAAGDYDHRDNNVDRDDHREPHGHDNYNYDDEGGRDNYYEDEEDDDDACRTPTASEYRIPDIRPCPPPPRKSRAVLMDDRSCTIGTTGSNGKLCSAHQQQHHHHHGGRLLLDFSKEVESMFPPLVQVNLGRKIKKARTA